MSRVLISKKTRYELQEHFVGKVLREIEPAFDAADVSFDAQHVPRVSGARRSLVQQYYHAVDWTKWDDVRKVLVLYQNVLAELEEGSRATSGWDTQYAKRAFDSLMKWIERDGFEYRDGTLVPIGGDAHLPHVQAAAAKFDAPELHRQIERMLGAVDDDPALAVGIYYLLAGWVPRCSRLMVCAVWSRATSYAARSDRRGRRLLLAGVGGRQPLSRKALHALQRWIGRS